MRQRIAEAKRWTSIADRDLAGAKRMLESDMPDLAVYHYHQAAEKYLKAFLSLHGEPLRKSHDIAALLLKCASIDRSFPIPSNVDDVDEMTQFATKFRYPNEEEVDFPDTKEIDIAQKLSEEIQNIVNEKLSVFEASVPPPG